MKLKLISYGLRSEDTRVLDENGEIIEGIQSLKINIEAGKVGEVTLVMSNIEVFADFDREQVKAKPV
jgi:hypothetical protein